MFASRMSDVYVLPVKHTYVGCFKDKRGDRDLLLVPKARSVRTPVFPAENHITSRIFMYWATRTGASSTIWLLSMTPSPVARNAEGMRDFMAST